jgi:hypothetical protein
MSCPKGKIQDGKQDGKERCEKMGLCGKRWWEGDGHAWDCVGSMWWEGDVYAWEGCGGRVMCMHGTVWEGCGGKDVGIDVTG